jgi:hypothetical protein
MIYPVSRKNRYLREFPTRRVFIPGKDIGEATSPAPLLFPFCLALLNDPQITLLYPQILKSPTSSTRSPKAEKRG